MSDDDGGETLPEKPFYTDRAKTGRANCKKCKQKIESGALRIAKMASNPFGDGKMKMWHHVSCIFEAFKRQRATTARINSPDDLEGWDTLTKDDQEEILVHMPAADSITQKKPGLPTSTKKKPGNSKDTGKMPGRDLSQDKDKILASTSTSPQTSPPKKAKLALEDHKDNSFREFRRLCADLSNESSYTGKTALVKKLFSVGSDGSGFCGDMLMWCRLLLPQAVKRIYNLQSKQLVKLFSRILHTNLDAMLTDLEQGDVAETVRVFFEKSSRLKPTKKSTLTLIDVDTFLTELSAMTKEDDQALHFTNIAARCTSNDMKMIVRLVKHDLRINAGPKHILEAVHEDAYQAFQTSRDLTSIVLRVTNQSASPSKEMISVALMTPVQPMLAEPCRAVEDAMKKCPNGMFSEIKYDGERVQVHKCGNEFKYFSRSLKPVLQHKIAHFKQYIPDAFPHGKDLILDAEILMIDTLTEKPLPFGTLGKHKKTAFQEANVCLFVFDCLYYNGQVLMKTTIQERRRILEENMKEIKHHIVLSEMEEIHTVEELESMITKVFKLGLEGLVLKDRCSIYEPGKRHWLKVKKDYLLGGAMADSVDLVVLGAWYGTGSKGGMMSSFLMGVFDTLSNKWCTVTKVHGGHDDATLENLQSELKMVKISKDATRVPSWLNVTKSMIPDFVAEDPEAMPVWEITGAEFTKHEVHTAHGISIRFPRVTKIRNDKDWKTATSLQELNNLFDKSKDSGDFTLIGKTTPQKSPSRSSKQSPKTVPKKILTETTTKYKQLKTNKSPIKTSSEDVSPAVKKKVQHFSPRHRLPAVFNGVKLIIPKSVKSTLERHFISYGGTSLAESDASQSTHVVYVAGNCCDLTWPNEARHLDIQWIEDSIKLQATQEPRSYAVQHTTHTL